MSSALDYYRVTRVIDELRACGLLNPGVREICEGLRARGLRPSAPSVYKHLRKWRSQQFGSTESSAQIPPDLPTDPMGFVRITVETLVALQQEIVQLRTQAGDLADGCEAQQNQIEALQSQLMGHTPQCHFVEGQCSALTEINERLRHELHVAWEEGAKARLDLALNKYSEEHYTRRVAMQQAELDRLQKLLGEERQRATAALIEQVDLSSQLRSALAQLAQVRGEADVIREQLTFARRQISESERNRAEMRNLVEEGSADPVSRKPN